MRAALWASTALLLVLPCAALAQEKVVGGGVYTAVSVTPAFAGLGVMLQSDTGIATTSTMNITNTTHWYYRLVVKGQQGVAGAPTTKTTWEGPALLQAHSGDACEISAGTQRGQCSALDNSAAVQAQWSFNDATGTAPGSSHQILFKGDAIQAHINIPGVWNVYDFSCDTAAQVCAAALNGVNILGNWWTLANAVPLNMLTDFNTGGLAFLNSGTGSFGRGYGEFSIDMYDTQQAPICLGTNTPSTITGLGTVTCGVGSAGTFPPEFFAKTISSIPADPYAAGTAAIPADPGASCTAYFGFTMSHCNIAGATTPLADLLVEKGSATPASALTYQTVTTHGGTGFPSDFGPAGIPAHQPTVRWSTYQRFPAGGTTVDALVDANTIKSGDFVVLFFDGASNSPGAPPTSATCPSDGNTWTQKFMRDTASNSAGTSYLACYGFVTTNLTGPFTATFSTTLLRSRSSAVIDFANVASVDAGATCFLYNTPAPAPHKTCSATTSSANETVLSAWFSNESDDAQAPWNFPATGFVVNPIFRVPDTPDAQMMFGVTHAVASGTNVQASATSFAAATGDSSYGLSISLDPN